MRRSTFLGQPTPIPLCDLSRIPRLARRSVAFRPFGSTQPKRRGGRSARRCKRNVVNQRFVAHASTIRSSSAARARAGPRMSGDVTTPHTRAASSESSPAADVGALAENRPRRHDRLEMPVGLLDALVHAPQGRLVAGARSPRASVSPSLRPRRRLVGLPHDLAAIERPDKFLAFAPRMPPDHDVMPRSAGDIFPLLQRQLDSTVAKFVRALTEKWNAVIVRNHAVHHPAQALVPEAEELLIFCSSHVARCPRCHFRRLGLRAASGLGGRAPSPVRGSATGSFLRSRRPRGRPLSAIGLARRSFPWRCPARIPWPHRRFPGRPACRAAVLLVRFL